MKTGVVVIYFNPDLAVLEMLKIYSKYFDNVLIYDNSEHLNHFIVTEAKKFCNVQYVASYENMGISKALQYAFKWSEDLGLDYLLTMDQDSILTEGAINNMFSFIRQNINENIAIFSMNYAKLYSDRNGGVSFGKYIQRIDEVREVKFSMTSGSFFVVSKLEIQTKLPDYFIGFVDQDICYRALSNGFKIVRVGNSIFHQQVGSPVQSSLKNKIFNVVNLSDVRYYYMFRNLNYLSREYKKYRFDFYYYRLRLIFNVLFFEKNKFEKIKMIHLGRVHFRKGIMSKYES